ncbi:hypothetical protein J2X46_003160 [Nocardioides sp. BE266]|uniref:hypothetical protein n=1 Tax=Nocardioides sp. BE266 TaxID=2817725 RepID=UPI00285D6501|nr:hypothetical protein [Nocardioides sp. BE266]MDR7254167.1 hypothetical protein [Nocardioides sp. BE266]
MTNRTRSGTARRSRRERAVVALSVVSTLMCAASCGGNEPDNGNQPTDPSPTSATSDTTEPTPTEPTTSEPATDEEKAAAALLGYLDVRDKAYATGRISKKLNKYATGQEHFALQQFVQQLTSPPETRFQGAWDHDVINVDLKSGGSALVTDCEDGSDVNVVRVADSSVLPWIKFEGKELPRRLEQVYRVEMTGGRWKVSSAESLPNEVAEC